MTQQFNNTTDSRIRFDDLIFKKIKQVDHIKRPSQGWIKEMRNLLGMTVTQLSKRLKVEPSTVTRLEQSEANDAITLKSLKTVAENLECELVYFLIPKKDIMTTLYDRADEVLKKQSDKVRHTMSLEGQDDYESVEETIKKSNLILTQGNKLWDE